MYGDSSSRMRVWNELIENFLSDQDGVVAEGRIGIVTAGPPGGGKSTQLESSFGSLGEWRVIDPDRVKVLLIRKALDDGDYEELLRINLADGRPVMPLELSGLVHEESVQIAREIRRRCMQLGENVIIEGTLSWKPMIDVHLEELVAHGYDRLEILSLAVPRDVALERALTRWWSDRCDLETELGGRFVPRETIDGCYTEQNEGLCERNAAELEQRARRQEGLEVEILQASRSEADAQRPPLRAVGSEE